jgi:ABC-2 type transport system permease protein
VNGVFFRSVYLKTLHDQRKITLWVGIGLIAAALYTTLIFPVVRDASGLEEFISQLPEVITSLMGGALEFTTPEGFLNTQPFSVLAPLLTVVYAVVRGAAVIAGEEEGHTLDQLLSNPVSRPRLLIEKAAAVETGLATLCVVLYLGIIAGMSIAGFSLDLWRLAQVVLSLFLLASASAMLAAGIGAATGRRSLAGGVTAGVFITGWLFNAIQQLADVLEWTKFLSMSWYYNGNNVLLHGLVGWQALTLAALAAVALAVGAVLFQRRDLHG